MDHTKHKRVWIAFFSQTGAEIANISEQLNHWPDLIIVNERNIVHARHLFPIRVPSNHRDNLIKYLQEFNIGIVVNYRSLNKYELLLLEQNCW